MHIFNQQYFSLANTSQWFDIMVYVVSVVHTFMFLLCWFQKISAGAGAVYLAGRIVYALGYYSGGRALVFGYRRYKYYSWASNWRTCLNATK